MSGAGQRGNAVAFALRDACQRADTHEVKSIAVRAGVSRPETMATLVVTSERDKRVRAASRRALAGHRGADIAARQHPPARRCLHLRRETRHIAGPERLREDVGDASFLISPTSFFQTNVRAANSGATGARRVPPAQTSSISTRARDCLRFRWPAGHTVVAIEENRSAVADGQASLRLSRVPETRCRFIAKPVELALGRGRDVTLQDFDVGRPRSATRRVSAVSDRTRLRRARSRESGVCVVRSGIAGAGPGAHHVVRLRIECIQPVDMFPHTPHIETVAVLTRSAYSQLPTPQLPNFQSPSSQVRFNPDLFGRWELGVGS